MTRVSLLLAAVTLIGFAGTAAAGNTSKHTGGESFNGAGGGCLLIEGGEQISVGEMMQTLRSREEKPYIYAGNPKHIVDSYPTAGWGNVGGLIAAKCGDPS